MRGRAAATAGLALLLAASGAGADLWRVGPGGPPLAEALALARPGDEVRVEGGLHPGPLVVDKPLRLVGIGWPILEGGGRGTVVTLAAAGAEISGFVLRGSGSDLEAEDSGLVVSAPGARVEGNRLEDVLFGVSLAHAAGSVVRGNRIAAKPLSPARRGDAIRVWWSDGVTLEANEVAGSRDVVLWYSKRLLVRGNRVEAGRYGLHFMYCDDAAIEGNLLAGNSVGAYLMYSRRLRFARNALVGNRGPSGYGLGLKEMDDVAVGGNLFAGNRVGMFLDNAPLAMGSFATVEGNLVAGNDVGVELLPNVRGAAFTGNSLVENGEQVAVATSGLAAAANRWAGNHWSDYVGFDADGDGTGDLPYRAERLFESLADRRPELRLFDGSPVARALDLAARAFPVVRPQPKLRDERPAMRAHRLAGLPALPRGTRRSLGPAALGGLLAGAMVLLAFPGASRRRRLRPGNGRVEAAPGPAAGLAIEARDLTVRFGRRRALDGVSFALRAGEAVALWGPNGAGKTTALRALLGVVRGDGFLAVGGLDPRRRGKAVRRLLGFVPQEVALPAEMEVEEALHFFARLRRAPAERAAALAAELGLAEHAGARIGSLSGGLKQRLALAVALLADPPILLLDEPTANLDARARASFLDLLGGLRRAGKTLVFSSHRREEVELLADRVLHLAAGRLIADAAVLDVSLTGESDPEERHAQPA